MERNAMVLPRNVLLSLTRAWAYCQLLDWTLFVEKRSAAKTRSGESLLELEDRSGDGGWRRNKSG